jgi:hypothetical protein
MERGQLSSQEPSRRTPQAESYGQTFCWRLAPQDLCHCIIEDFYLLHIAKQRLKTWLAPYL